MAKTTIQSPCFLLLGLLLLMSSCATLPDKEPAIEPAPVPGLEIHGLLIFNGTSSVISTAQLLVPATGGFVSCGNILPRSQCSTLFPEQEYRERPVNISWTKGAQSWSTGDISIQLPAIVDPELPAYVRVIIVGPGVAGASIVQVHSQ
jgi:hypothetical protein